uniref:Replication protein A 14 kDa subunit n=1 Tax=Ursus americanus TaxID=9643 RepID=A0A452S9J5_URSAM
GASRGKRYLRLAPQSLDATAQEHNTQLPGSNPAGRPEIAGGNRGPAPCKPLLHCPLCGGPPATSGTPRVTKQPIPASGSSPPCSVRFWDCAIAIEISAHLIGGVRELLSADWCRHLRPRRRREPHNFSRLFPAGRRSLTATMVDVMELPRSRVNASMLAQFIDRPVCFVGRLEKIHPTGKMFILSDGEGKNGTIELMEPLDEEISGIVEVVGRVTAKATIMCASYVQFKEDNHPFDLGLYNEAVKITHEFPQFFPLGVVQYD